LLTKVSDPHTSEPVHDARIVAKRVRYLIEPIESEVKEAKAAVKELKALQDALGALHDLHVAAAELVTGADQRAATEAAERTREVLTAASEGRPARRWNSALSGFGSVASALRDQQVAAFATIEARWLVENAEHPLGCIDVVVDALERRAYRDVEIERKYLLAGTPDVPDDATTTSTDIEQGYLPGSSIQERIRRETRDGHVHHTRTVKLGRGLVRTEVEESLTVELFERLWPLTEGRRVLKRRIETLHVDQRWTVDVFLDRDLVLAEIELRDPDDDPELPEWLRVAVVREVTNEREFSNVELAR
jgi:CYTH domain-containing protein